MIRASSPPALEFHRREPVRHGLRRLGGLLATAARAEAARPPAEQASAVHEMRRLLKRLRALVRLLRPTLGDATARRHNRRLRLAARRLAGARDATVGLLTLDRLGQDASREDTAALAEVRAGFTRAVHDRHVREAVVARHLNAAAKALATSVHALDRLPWKRSGWATLEAGLRAGYRRARRRAKAARPTREESGFHAWRTATKSLLYQIALVRPAQPTRIRPVLDALDALQENLGQEHDLEVLRARLAQRPRAFGSPAAVQRTLELIASRQQALRKDCLRRGRKLFAQPPATFIARYRSDWKKWRARSK
jgi:CHAD domain-containing protein